MGYKNVSWVPSAYLAFAILVVLTVPHARAQSGHVLNGVGPVDQAMSGAGMAMPQDALTALHWSPAGIVDISGNNLALSLQVMQPTGTISSTVNAGAFGDFGPGATLSGATDSDAGPFPIPAVGFVHAPAGGRWAVGFSAFGVGGFGVDYAATGNGGGNPVLMAQPPMGYGFGAISSEFALMQVSPTFAYRVSNTVSIGFSPTLNYASLKVAPFPAASPDDANGDGFPTYEDAPKDWAPGFGVQAGVAFHGATGFSVAASFKSAQLFKEFEFDGQDELGNDRMLTFNLDYPMIVSAGVAYAGIERLVLAADVRYIDFENTDGFSESGYDNTGAVQGFGWNSILVGAVGIQYEVAPGVPLRAGYSYSENPIADEMTFFNTPAPAIIQHHISGGVGYEVGPNLRLAVAVQYGLKNEVTGAWITPLGSVPGTSVSSELSTLTVIAGVSIGLN